MSYREFITGQLDKAQARFAGNDAGNAPALAMLGGFKFSLNTAVFQAIESSDSYRWPAQERVGKLDALQFTGPGGSRKRLPGVVFPDFRGGQGQLDELRALAAQGQPLRLITGQGRVLGLWVVDEIDETQTEFKTDGTPRKQEFVVSIRKYADADV